MRRVLPIAFLLLTLIPARADAVTAREILELSRAGLSEEVLLALIEVDGGVFTLDTDMLKQLKEANVSERVILAMVRSGRSNPPESAPDTVAAQSPVDPPQVVAPPPQVIVIEHDRPVVEHVAVPVYIPVVASSRRVFTHGRVPVLQQPFDPSPGFGANLNQVSGFGVPVIIPEPVPVKQEPVFWGWGGKLRPDAWDPGPVAKQGRTPHGRRDRE
jgi:hypothetical protein